MKKKDKSLILISIISFIITLNALINIFYNDGVTRLTTVSISVGMLIGFLIHSKKHKMSKILNILLAIIIIFITGLFIYAYKTENVPRVINLTNQTLDNSLKWCHEHEVNCNFVYEYSDTVPKYEVFLQSSEVGTRLKDINILTLTVSDGPDFSKELNLKNLVNMNIDDAVKYILDNNLTNVDIIYEFNDNYERDIIYQVSRKGLMKRNDPLTLYVSFGPERELEDVKMIDLKNQSLFMATLFLKRNGIKYEIKEEFSDIVPINHVISSSTNEGDVIKVNETTVKLVISVGKEIVVPNLLTMSVDDIVKWTIDNKLKLFINEEFSSTVPINEIIKCDKKEGDKVKIGEKITITLSKGKLVMKKFTNLNDLRIWASNNDININEEYEFNNLVKGSIIKYSHAEGDVLNSGDTITVYISMGENVTVPNFFGKTKEQANTLCKNNDLNCTFKEAYSSRKKGTVISQNKKAGSKVAKNTYITLSLSKGPAPQPPACDTSKGAVIYIVPGYTGQESLNMFKRMNPGFNVSPEFVSACLNGHDDGGIICNINTYQEKWFSYCTTIKLKIVR
jgi:beta-lactam-binding protein with PASTA domain